MQRRATSVAEPKSAAAIVNDVLNMPGTPLDSATRTFMERRFTHNFCRVSPGTARSEGVPNNLTLGPCDSIFEKEAELVADTVAGNSPQGQYASQKTAGLNQASFDFSNIRIHANDYAAKSAQEVNSQAYTVGRQIVFNTGQFNSSTTAGKKLIAHELAHVLQQSGGSHARGGSPLKPVMSGMVQRVPAARPTSERVWGLPVTRTMCGCRQRVRDGIAWANTAGATYAACDTPVNTTGADVEACFDAAHPGTTTVGETSASGTMTLPPSSADPCERIENKATFVHETMHARHANAIARARGTSFFREWRRLAGDPNRLNTMRATFPVQVAAFEAQWDNGHDWAQDEVNSYKWERRFLVDTLAALNRIC